MQTRGSIRERRPSAYELRWRLDGRQWTETVHGTRQQAQKALTARLKAADDGDSTAPSKITLGAFLALWLAQKGKTAAWYRTNGDGVRHWTRLVGDKRLQALTAIDVMRARDALLEGTEWAADLAHGSTPGMDKSSGLRRLVSQRRQAPAGLSPKTVANDLAMLVQALSWGQKMGFVGPKNVAQAVDRPVVERKPIVTLNRDQADALLDVLWAWERPETTLLALGLLLGLRTYSELGGMRRSDLDMTRRTLMLDQVLLTAKVRGRWTQVLAPAGNNKHKRRLIHVPEVAVPWLERQLGWLKGQYDAHDDLTWGGGLLFPNVYGEPVVHSTVHRVFKEALGRAGLPAVRIHDLRHTTASLLLAKGVHPKVVQEVLGHSTIAMTLNVYSHLMPGATADALDGVYGDRTADSRAM